MQQDEFIDIPKIQSGAPSPVEEFKAALKGRQYYSDPAEAAQEIWDSGELVGLTRRVFEELVPDPDRRRPLREITRVATARALVSKGFSETLCEAQWETVWEGFDCHTSPFWVRVLFYLSMKPDWWEDDG